MKEDRLEILTWQSSSWSRCGGFQACLQIVWPPPIRMKVCAQTLESGLALVTSVVTNRMQLPLMWGWQKPCGFLPGSLRTLVLWRPLHWKCSLSGPSCHAVRRHKERLYIDALVNSTSWTVLQPSQPKLLDMWMKDPSHMDWHTECLLFSFGTLFPLE